MHAIRVGNTVNCIPLGFDEKTHELIVQIETASGEISGVVPVSDIFDCDEGRLKDIVVFDGCLRLGERETLRFRRRFPALVMCENPVRLSRKIAVEHLWQSLVIKCQACEYVPVRVEHINNKQVFVSVNECIPVTVDVTPLKQSLVDAYGQRGFRKLMPLPGDILLSRILQVDSDDTHKKLYLDLACPFEKAHSGELLLSSSPGTYAAVTNTMPSVGIGSMSDVASDIGPDPQEEEHRRLISVLMLSSDPVWARFLCDFLDTWGYRTDMTDNPEMVSGMLSKYENDSEQVLLVDAPMLPHIQTMDWVALSAQRKTIVVHTGSPNKPVFALGNRRIDQYLEWTKLQLTGSWCYTGILNNGLKFLDDMILGRKSSERSQRSHSCAEPLPLLRICLLL